MFLKEAIDELFDEPENAINRVNNIIREVGLDPEWFGHDIKSKILKLYNGEIRDINIGVLDELFGFNRSEATKRIDIESKIGDYNDKIKTIINLINQRMGSHGAKEIRKAEEALQSELSSIPISDSDVEWIINVARGDINASTDDIYSYVKDITKEIRLINNEIKSAFNNGRLVKNLNVVNIDPDIDKILKTNALIYTLLNKYKISKNPVDALYSIIDQWSSDVGANKITNIRLKGRLSDAIREYKHLSKDLVKELGNYAIKINQILNRNIEIRDNTINAVNKIKKLNVDHRSAIIDMIKKHEPIDIEELDINDIAKEQLKDILYHYNNMIGREETTIRPIQQTEKKEQKKFSEIIEPIDVLQLSLLDSIGITKDIRKLLPSKNIRRILHIYNNNSLISKKELKSLLPDKIVNTAYTAILENYKSKNNLRIPVQYIERYLDGIYGVDLSKIDDDKRELYQITDPDIIQNKIYDIIAGRRGRYNYIDKVLNDLGIDITKLKEHFIRKNREFVINKILGDRTDDVDAGAKSIIYDAYKQNRVIDIDELTRMLGDEFTNEEVNYIHDLLIDNSHKVIEAVSKSKIFASHPRTDYPELNDAQYNTMINDLLIDQNRAAGAIDKLKGVVQNKLNSQTTNIDGINYEVAVPYTIRIEEVANLFDNLSIKNYDEEYVDAAKDIISRIKNNEISNESIDDEIIKISKRYHINSDTLYEVTAKLLDAFDLYDLVSGKHIDYSNVELYMLPIDYVKEHNYVQDAIKNAPSDADLDKIREKARMEFRSSLATKKTNFMKSDELIVADESRVISALMDIVSSDDYLAPDFDDLHPSNVKSKIRPVTIFKDGNKKFIKGGIFDPAITSGFGPMTPSIAEKVFIDLNDEQIQRYVDSYNVYNGKKKSARGVVKRYRLVITNNNTVELFDLSSYKGIILKITPEIVEKACMDIEAIPQDFIPSIQAQLINKDKVIKNGNTIYKVDSYDVNSILNKIDKTLYSKLNTLLKGALSNVAGRISIERGISYKMSTRNQLDNIAVRSIFPREINVELLMMGDIEIFVSGSGFAEYNDMVDRNRISGHAKLSINVPNSAGDQDTEYEINTNYISPTKLSCILTKDLIKKHLIENGRIRVNNTIMASKYIDDGVEKKKIHSGKVKFKIIRGSKIRSKESIKDYPYRIGYNKRSRELTLSRVLKHGTQIESDNILTLSYNSDKYVNRVYDAIKNHESLKKYHDYHLKNDTGIAKYVSGNDIKSFWGDIIDKHLSENYATANKNRDEMTNIYSNIY